MSAVCEHILITLEVKLHLEMDQIDFNMEESPFEEENFAQMVERRLVELREQCSDPEQKVSQSNIISLSHTQCE